MWKGTISFGMVSIPVRLYLAAESNPTPFRQLCARHTSPIRNRRWCVAGDHEVPYADLVKGFEVATDEYVVLSDADLERLPLPAAHTIAITEFLPRQSVPEGLYVRTAHYVEAEPPGRRPHSLLYKALEETGTVALSKIALREREHPALLQPLEGGLILSTLRWPAEIRDHQGIAFAAGDEFTAAELKMAKQLVQSLRVETFDPSQMVDEYRGAVEGLVEAKLAGHEVVSVRGEEPAARVVDLMAALKASIEAARAAPAPPSRRAAATGARRSRKAAS